MIPYECRSAHGVLTVRELYEALSAMVWLNSQWSQFGGDWEVDPAWNLSEVDGAAEPTTDEEFVALARTSEERSIFGAPEEDERRRCHNDFCAVGAGTNPFVLRVAAGS